jgi:zinc/manganese transport system substrate-binding protein
MKKKIMILILCFCGCFFSFAKFKIIATYPYIKSICEQIGKDKIEVCALANGNYDPHTIVPKPSLIGKLRNADLLIINGAQLEIGWLPPLLEQANNPVVMPGKEGFLELSNFVELIQVPESVSREQGDVHPAGNPHFVTDPLNVTRIGQAILDILCKQDQANANYYQQNGRYFLKRWEAFIVELNEKFSQFKGISVIEYHRNMDYLFNRYQINVIDTMEPLPGIPPTTKHLLDLMEKIKQHQVAYIIHDTYHSKKCSEFLSEKTGIPYIVMPHDVEALPEIKDIFDLFEECFRRLKK